MFVKFIRFDLLLVFMLRANQSRARKARLVFLLLMLTSGALVIFSMVAQSLPDWEADADSSSTTTSIFSVVYGLTLLSHYACLAGSYVVLIMWLRRAYYNLHQLPTIRPEFSEGWAAGAWFVPFLNLVRPYSIMREVWQDTQKAAWGRIVEPATILGWWWAAFVIKMIVSRITSKMGSSGNGITQDDLVAFMVDAGAQFVAAGLTWHVIGRAASFEEELAVRQQVNQLGQPISLPVSHKTDQSDYQLEEGY